MQLSDMAGRVLARLDQPSGGAYYTHPEAVSALNEAQRFFAFLTLGVQKSALVQIALAAGNPTIRMLPLATDWLLPLRVSVQGGAQLRPARLEDLDALDSNWQNQPATQTLPLARYAALGFDLVAFYPQPAAGTWINFTYAATPAPMAADTDVPQIPEEHHQDLVDYATYRLRYREGGAEFAKGLPYLRRFMEGAAKYGRYIRQRNIAARYDKLPFEIERADLSALLDLDRRLVPVRRTNDGE
jgi:hypothetical protein